MDALSDVIKAAQLAGGVFLHAEFREPWCLRDELDASLCDPFLKPVTSLIHYHFIVEGEMRVRGDGEPDPLAGVLPVAGDAPGVRGR